MKQIIVSVLIFIVCISYSYAESKDSNEYQKLTKNYITEVIYAAMMSCEEASSIGKLNEAENIGMIKFKESYYSKANWEYIELYEFLKENSWSRISEGFFQEWEGIIKNDSIGNESKLEFLLKSVVVCPYKAEKIPELFEIKVSGIQTDYEDKLIEILKVNEQVSIVPESVQLESRSRDRINGYQESTSSLDALHYLLMILVVVLSFFCFRFYREKENTKRRNGDLKLEIQDYKGAIFQNGSTKKEVIKTSRKVRNNKGIDVLSHDELKNTNKDKNGISADGNIKGESHDDFKPKSQSVEKVSANQAPEQVMKKALTRDQDSIPQYKTSHLYFEEFEDGVFVVRSGRKQKNSWSVFCISTTSENEGNVALLHQDMAQEIITNKEMYLSDTICDVSYQTGGSMSKIVSALPGKVRLDGNKWIVTEKVKVVIN